MPPPPLPLDRRWWKPLQMYEETIKALFFCTSYKRSVLVRLEDNRVQHSTQALDNIWCHHYFYAFLKMALGILIKTQRRIWFEVLPRVRTSQPDWTANGSFWEFLALENSRHLACVAWRFWSGSQTSQGGRGQVKLRGFLFFSLLRSSFARFWGFAAQWCARLNCHATQVTDMWRRHQRFPHSTGNRSEVKVTVQVSLLAPITVQNRVLA